MLCSEPGPWDGMEGDPCSAPHEPGPSAPFVRRQSVGGTGHGGTKGLAVAVDAGGEGERGAARAVLILTWINPCESRVSGEPGEGGRFPGRLARGWVVADGGCCCSWPSARLGAGRDRLRSREAPDGRAGKAGES